MNWCHLHGLLNIYTLPGHTKSPRSSFTYNHFANNILKITIVWILIRCNLFKLNVTIQLVRCSKTIFDVDLYIKSKSQSVVSWLRAQQIFQKYLSTGIQAYTGIVRARALTNRWRSEVRRMSKHGYGTFNYIFL